LTSCPCASLTEDSRLQEGEAEGTVSGPLAASAPLLLLAKILIALSPSPAKGENEDKGELRVTVRVREPGHMLPRVKRPGHIMQRVRGTRDMLLR
jgi:hypothetical protein